MKKMMTIMASLATTLFAFGAVGDVSAPPAGFESYNSGDGFVPSVVEGGSTYWYAAAVDDTNIITNYADSGTSVPELATGVVRPDGMKENDAYPSNSKFLSLETSTPLFRSVQANNQDGTFTGSTIGESGIYLDTLVKFTASEEEFKDGALEADVDKIAIAYVEHGEESLNTNDPTDTPFTNFVIRAGYIGTSAISQKNYRAYLPDDPTLENFDKDAWHRLTVRAIANIGGNNVGFIVYLDQKPLAYDGACGDDFSPLTDVQNYYNDEIHAVYPSAIEASDIGGDQIAAVAFSGNGSIDDVVFTTEKPAFITASESVIVPFVADAGVTAISVEVDDDVVTNIAVTAAGTYAATLEAQTTAFTVNVTVDEANGYTLGGISYNGDPVVNGEVTGYAGGDITITTVRNNFNLFDENRDPIQGTYQTLTEALAVEGVAKIQLAHNYEVTEAEITAAEESIYTIDGDVVIDLYGMTLDGGEGNGFELFYVTGSLKVIDSVGGGKIVYGGDVFGSEGSLLIGDVSGDNGVTIDGVLLNAGAPGYIIRANVLANGNTDTGTDTFLWAAYLGDGESVESAATLTGNYWVVEPQSTPEPVVIPTYTLTIPIVANASAVVTSNSVVVADLTAIPSNTEVLVTWSAESGYKITAGATENITMDGNKEAAAPTVAAIDYATLTIESVANCTIVVSNATAEVATGAKFDKADAVQLTVYRTPAEDYELDGYAATENITMDQDQTVTAAVKQSGGSYPSYIPTEDAAVKEKYDAWATKYGADTGSANKDAFLLNCAPAEVEDAKEAFKVTITVNPDGSVTVTAPTGYNVTPTIQGKQTLSDSEEWHSKAAGDKFFRAILDL